MSVVYRLKENIVADLDAQIGAIDANDESMMGKRLELLKDREIANFKYKVEFALEGLFQNSTSEWYHGSDFDDAYKIAREAICNWSNFHNAKKK